MITDFQILGIERTSDLQVIKSAFRKRAKELHPDLARDEDSLEHHDRFVELCRAYARLVESCAEARLKPPDRRQAPGATASSGGMAASGPIAGAREGQATRASRAACQVTRYVDQAYAFYKAGMKYFSAIHPSQWNLDTGRMLNTAIAGHEEEQAIIKRRVLDLMKLFPRAYYYFGIVVHEYPDSDWAYDAAEKLSTIEERVRRYRKIIESFSTWNIDRKKSIKAYHEKYDATVQTQKAVRRDPPPKWGSDLASRAERAAAGATLNRRV